MSADLAGRPGAGGILGSCLPPSQFTKDYTICNSSFHRRSLRCRASAIFQLPSRHPCFLEAWMAPTPLPTSLSRRSTSAFAARSSYSGDVRRSPMGMKALEGSCVQRRVMFRTRAAASQREGAWPVRWTAMGARAADRHLQARLRGSWTALLRTEAESGSARVVCRWVAGRDEVKISV